MTGPGASVRVGARRAAHAALVAAVVAVVMAGCNSDDDAETSAPPVPTASVGSATETWAETTPQATSTMPESTTTELNPVPTTPPPPSTTTIGTVEFPPVSTLVPQVPDELLTPGQLDPFNVNNSRPILPEHVPVIEAYLRASDAFGAVASQSPINPDAPELLAAAFTPEALQENQSSLRDRAERGEVLNVSQGVTNRPYVIGPVTDTAVVFDCFIDGEYWTSATGEPIPPTAVWQAGPGSIVEVGLRLNMVQRDGRWLADTGQIDEGACA